MAGGKPSVTFAKGEAPADKFNIVKILAFFAGFAVLFPSSALTASSDLYTEIFGEESGENLIFYMSLAITLTSPFCQLLVQRFQNKLSYTSRIMSCLGANTILCALFPFVLMFFASKVAFVFVVLFGFLIGMNNAVLKLSFFSLTSYYPASYQQDIVFGKGLSPLLVVLLKMCIKKSTELWYPNDHSTGIRRGSIIFFALAALIPALCMVIYRYARKTSLFSKHFFPSFRVRKLILAAQHPDAQQNAADIHPSLAGLTANEDQEELHLETDAQGDNDQENLFSGEDQKNSSGFGDMQSTDFLPPASSSTTSGLNVNVVGATNGEYISLDDENDQGDLDGELSPGLLPRTQSSFDPKPEIAEPPVNNWNVLIKVSLPAFILALTMMITYTIYPSIINKSKPTFDITKGWFRLWLLLIFASSDFISRSLPYKVILKICPVRSLDFLAYARILLIPIFAYSVYIQTLASQVLIIATVVMGFTNGIVFVVTMRNYSHLVKDHERSTAGSFMSIAVVVGVMFGTLLAILIDKVAKI